MKKSATAAIRRTVKTSMETVLLTREEIERWQVPSFQRPLNVNAKVRALAEDLKTSGGIMPGVITIGRLPNDRDLYIADGQHRRAAFMVSGLPECIVDVRTCHFDSIADMADEFVALNSALVKMRPDDLLRGLESTSAGLRRLRERCPFIGYGNIRRNNQETTPVLSMSAVLRCWFGSAGEVPSGTGGGRSSVNFSTDLDELEADRLSVFLLAARAAWGSDKQNFRLWGALNLTITAWLWRKLVLQQERGVKRYAVLTPDQFKKCLMSVSANHEYIDWLAGRLMNDRDRSPCLDRLKRIFRGRLAEEPGIGRAPMLPQPSWSSG